MALAKLPAIYRKPRISHPNDGGQARALDVSVQD